MGEALYEEVVGTDGKAGAACRIYAPVGPHEDLVAYLVRRLLENGANTSFVHRLADQEAPVADDHRGPGGRGRGRVAERCPVAATAAAGGRSSCPSGATVLRFALDQAGLRRALVADIGAALEPGFVAAPVIDGEAEAAAGAGAAVLSPHDRRQRIGTVHAAGAEQIERAIAGAVRAAHAWDRLGGPARAAILEAAADLYERDRVRLMGVMVREAGKTLEQRAG